MRHLTKDLVPCIEAKKRLLKPAELCEVWRNAPYRLAFNELTQEVELDGRPLPVADIEEAYIGLSEVCLLYTSPSPRDQRGSRMPSSA